MIKENDDSENSSENEGNPRGDNHILDIKKN